MQVLVKGIALISFVEPIPNKEQTGNATFI